MNEHQFAEGLAQLLQSYQRAGISQLSRTTTGAFHLEVVRQRLEPRMTESSAAPTITPMNSTPPAALPSSSVPKKTDQVFTPAMQTVQALAGWQLPVLSTDERASRLNELDMQVKSCRQCEELISYRRQTVFGEGSLRPRVCFYGEAPGADEDAQGRPFVGAAGKLLNDIISAMKLTREEVYIVNSLKCRPPQNRTPLPEEVDNCRRFAHQQLEILQPEFLILLGSVAVRSVLQSTESVGRLRGRFHRFHGSRVLVTYHPAYLLRTPAAKKMVWEDVQLVMRELE